MTGPFGTVEEYLERVAMSTVELVSADDRDARGVVVTVESGTARCERAFLREFLFRIAEDAVDSEVGGTGHGSFCAPAYSGLLQRQPDRAGLPALTVYHRYGPFSLVPAVTLSQRGHDF